MVPKPIPAGLTDDWLQSLLGEIVRQALSGHGNRQMLTSLNKLCFRTLLAKYCATGPAHVR